MAEPVYIYNPDDEGDVQAFNGTHFHLGPNQTTDISQIVEDARAGAPARWGALTAEDAARHICQELGRFGVCRTRGRVKRQAHGGGWSYENPEDQPLVKAAEEVYLQATREWATELAINYHRAAKPNVDAGLPPPKPSPQEEKAMKWLKEHRDPLR